MAEEEEEIAGDAALNDEQLHNLVEYQLETHRLRLATMRGQFKQLQNDLAGIPNCKDTDSFIHIDYLADILEQGYKHCPKELKKYVDWRRIARDEVGNGVTFTIGNQEYIK